jgi:hypothetical protein
MKLVMLVSLLIFLGFVFLSFRRELPPGHALGIVALVGLNRCFLGSANGIGSDLPFMAVLYLTIFLIQKAYDEPDATRPKWRYLLPVSLLICVAFGLRTVGIVLVPSLVFYELLRYRRITPSAVLVGVVFVAAAAAQSLWVHSDASYLDQYDVGPRVFLHNAIGYATEFAGFWHNGYFKPLGLLLFLVLSAFGALGYAASVRRKISFLEIFPILYLMAVLAFPGYAGKRYLQPIFPLYLLFVARGLEHAWFARRAAFRRAVLTGLATAVALSYAAACTQLHFDITEGVSKPESLAMFDFVRSNTHDDDVMIFIKPRVMALLTSRRASVYHMPQEDCELWEYFKRIGATHLVVVENDDALAGAEDPARLAYLREFAKRNRGGLTPVFGNADFRVYRLAGQDAAASHLFTSD